MSLPPVRTGAPNTTALVRGFNALGLSLLRHAPAGTNCLLSPLSVATVLSALCAGARGVTREELARLIGGPDDDGALSSAVKALLQRVRLRTFEADRYDAKAGRFTTVERDAFALRSANALFVQSAYPLLRSYHETLRSAFDADLMALDFADAELSAARINDWVAKRTNGKIEELVQPVQLSPRTRIVVANAVHFFAEWASQFSPERTRPRPFHLLPGEERSTVDAPMMHQTVHLQHWIDPDTGFGAVRIPYRALGMVVLLPEPGRLDAVERSLTAEGLERIIARMEVREVDLVLPRFALRSQMDLADSLTALGVRVAFDRERADFSGISDHPDGLYVTAILHEAVIRVDEYGTEAAAATAATMEAEGVDVEEPIPFVVDRPFLYAIHDHETGAVLFLGRVTNPAP